MPSLKGVLASMPSADLQVISLYLAFIAGQTLKRDCSEIYKLMVKDIKNTLIFSAPFHSNSFNRLFFKPNSYTTSTSIMTVHCGCVCASITCL